MKKVKARSSRISTKNQLTLPVEALRSAGVGPGDRMVVRVEGPGRLVLEREDDVIAEFAGSLTGVWPPDALDRLRDEWD